ncbi:hypothetical protein H0266_11035 [Halobacillus locisalis]|uniref:Uncharacterized protein n=1 Tax=Halobacillus locisalis TaxID=220753 RepID=A0A838CUE5_9BACI|nr:hypothetical protein [Halobacillus locisalis]MBA2175429.1 hypothetical protein [Halobacillus locisalis]
MYKVVIPVILLSVLVGGFLIQSNKSTELYGNNKESIVEVIHSIEGYEDYAVEILQVDDMNQDRVVSFLADGDPSYIQFKKNDDGDYEWKLIMVESDENFASFMPNLRSVNERSFLFVKNGESRVSHMKVDVNNQELEQSFQVNQPDVQWMDLPHTDEDSYSYSNHRYYSGEGELIDP